MHFTEQLILQFPCLAAPLLPDMYSSSPMGHLFKCPRDIYLKDPGFSSLRRPMSLAEL
jgi:hypothetical protein